MLGRCRWHDFTGDRPHKAYQFTGYGRGHFAFFLAAEVQVSITTAQTFLRLLGDGLYSWRSAFRTALQHRGFASRETKTVPVNGSRRSVRFTTAARPSWPLRKSTGRVATTIRTRFDGKIMPTHSAQRRSPRSGPPPCPEPLPSADRPARDRKNPLLGPATAQTPHPHRPPAEPAALAVPDDASPIAGSD